MRLLELELELELNTDGDEDAGHPSTSGISALDESASLAALNDGDDEEDPELLEINSAELDCDKSGGAEEDEDDDRIDRGFELIDAAAETEAALGEPTPLTVLAEEGEEVGLTGASTEIEAAALDELALLAVLDEEGEEDAGAF